MHPGSQGGRLEELLFCHPGIGRDAVQIASGEKTLCERREGDEPDTGFLSLVQDAILFRFPVQEIVPSLVNQAGDVPLPEILVGKSGGFRRIVGDARVQRLSGADDVHEGLHRLLQRGIGIEPVGVEEVHIVEVHPLQALVEARHEVLPGPPFAIGTRPHVITGLGRDEKLVAERSEGFPHDLPERFLGRPVGGAVVVRQVEMHDAVVKGVMGHFEGVRERVHVAEVVPEAQGDLGEEDAAAAAPAVADPAFIAVGGGGVNGVDHKSDVDGVQL